MHEIRHAQNRNVIPKWRPVSRSIALGEADSFKNEITPRAIRPNETYDSLQDALNAFTENPQAPYAAEVVAAAISAGNPLAGRYAAETLLAKSQLSPGLKRQAIACLSEQHDNFSEPHSLTGKSIRAFRQRLINEGPQSALAWLDVGLAYASIGEYEKAVKSLKVARGSMRNPSRLLIRAETRLFQHIGMPDRALWILHKDINATLSDPWLLAAEIGVCRLMDVTSRHIKSAKKVLSSDLSLFVLSELAAAIGTEELLAGAHKTSRRLFQKATTDPSEQGLAQTVWASTRLDKRIPIPQSRILRTSAEAQARNSLSEFKWRDAVEKCNEWLAEEPFASTPPLIQSAVLSNYLGDYTAALRTVDNALKANPNNPSLLNNKAYFLARLDRLDDALKLLISTRPWKGKATDTTLCAMCTLGLVLIRGNYVDLGKSLYRQAYDLARLIDRGGELSTRIALHYVAECQASGNLNPTADERLIRDAESKNLSDELKELQRALNVHTRKSFINRLLSNQKFLEFWPSEIPKDLPTR